MEVGHDDDAKRYEDTQLTAGIETKDDGVTSSKSAEQNENTGLPTDPKDSDSASHVGNPGGAALKDEISKVSTGKDATEEDLGISAYLSPEAPGFTAVLKARYSDFVVHEVGLDGKVACLDSLDPATTLSPSSVQEAENEATRKREHENDENEENIRKERKIAEATTTNWVQLRQELSEFVGDDPAAKAIEFLKSDEEDKGPSNTNTKSEGKQPMFVKLPNCDDKGTRRKLHEWIRNRLSFCAKADTIDDVDGQKNIRIWHVRYERHMSKFSQSQDRKQNSNNNNNRQNNRPPPDKKFLRFVLYKENMDTGAAISAIQRRAADFGGGRGGRGRSRGGRGGRGGRGSVRSLRMGYAGMKDKRGITCQFITVQSHTPLHILTSFNRSGEKGGGHTRTSGFGVMRIGNFEYVADELKLGCLQGNRFDIALRNVRMPDSSTIFDQATTKVDLEKAAKSLRQRGFINFFGVQRFGKYYNTHLTGFAVIKGDFEKAIDVIMEPKQAERPDIVQARKDWQARFSALPATASKGEKANAEKECAEKVLRQFNRFMASEVCILNSLMRNPLEYKRAFSGISKTLRMMFLHAVQSYLWNHAASYRVDRMGRDILVGDLVLDTGETHKSNYDAAKGSNVVEVHVVTEEDVKANRYSLDDVVLPLIGPSTKDPQNEFADILNSLLEKHGVTREMLYGVTDRDFNCGGDYRKLICRPSNVDFRLVAYKDPLQPLLQTDLMKLNGIHVETVDETTNAGSSDCLLAMIVGFTLPSSSYATIALRELMKQPTSADYQSELKLDNNTNYDEGEEDGDVEVNEAP